MTTIEERMKLEREAKAAMNRGRPSVTGAEESNKKPPTPGVGASEVAQRIAIVRSRQMNL